MAGLVVLELVDVVDEVVEVLEVLVVDDEDGVDDVVEDDVVLLGGVVDVVDEGGVVVLVVAVVVTVVVVVMVVTVELELEVEEVLGGFEVDVDDRAADGGGPDEEPSWNVTEVVYGFAVVGDEASSAKHPARDRLQTRTAASKARLTRMNGIFLGGPRENGLRQRRRMPRRSNPRDPKGASFRPRLPPGKPLWTMRRKENAWRRERPRGRPANGGLP